VTQKEVFDAHGRRYEKEFIEDMEALGVRMPDALSRVTEYVPQIVEFVQAIVAKGMAYASNGSVYMDIGAFKAAGHHYPKLEPSKGKATEAEMAESEGSHTAVAGEKRSASDFALWKASKAGEPSWDSPWGGGRPGWHIECSVMASDILGSNIDIHAGGVDLKFPHHDNELCQSEAFHGCGQWINHFWHFGHLEIKGLKMSKSLKNFITIRQALSGHTARQIRLVFLLKPWDKKLDFSDQTVDEAETKEKTLIAFFDNVKELLRDRAWLAASQEWKEPERTLSAAIAAAKATVHAALCDNFDTGSAMAALLSIASASFAYLDSVKKVTKPADALLLKSGAIYVTKMLRIFGVVTHEEVGFPIAAGGGAYEEQVAPIVGALVDFRDEVRTAAKATSPPNRALLDLCDTIRDQKAVDLGVRIEDRADGKALWSLADPEVMRKEKVAAALAALEGQVNKLSNKLVDKKKELAKNNAALLTPADYFKTLTDKYAQFDAEGKPIADAAGAELSKSAKKDVDKQWAKREKEHTKFAETLAKNPNMLDEQQGAIEGLQREVASLLAQPILQGSEAEDLKRRLQDALDA